jgi:Poly A polymerase head domain
MTREVVPAEDLRLPPCTIPRPGSRVTWFQNSMKLTGTLVGHGADGKPIIDGSDGPGERAGSFDCIRLENTNSTVEPNWSELPAAGLIVRALPAEVEAFKSLLNQHTPPGPKYFELVTEMWARGFETFVVGGTVRDVIAGQDSKDVDLITTMPLSLRLSLSRE